MQEEELQELYGKIASVIYTNEENGYTVLRLETQDGENVNVVGTLPSAYPGEELHVFGQWVTHPNHGRQFKSEYAERSLPRTREAIYAYLAGHAVRGIGPATAALIVDKFGDKTLEVLERQPERLTEIRGVSAAKAETISRDFRRQAGLRRLMEFLCSHELRPLLAVRLYRFYGEASMDVVGDDPYILASPHIGGTFAEADRLAFDLGAEADNPARVRAAAIFELRHNAGNGHCFIPTDKLAAVTAQFIGVEPDSAQTAIDSLAGDGTLVRTELSGRDVCYLAELYEAESRVAARLLAMAAGQEPETDVDAVLSTLESTRGVKYAPKQREAVRLAANSRVMALTGGPGTGKTTSLRAILAVYDSLGITTLLTAPTGRAAKRMSEVTGEEAKTIHRLLQVDWDEKDNPVFTRNERNPLECDCLVVDELSMVDAYVFESLLRALPFSCRLVLVGDNDQLPSVGAGNVLGDLIASGLFPTVQLKEIFRQSQESLIVMSAHRIVEGKLPDLRRHDSDFFFLPQEDPQKAAQLIVSLCSVRLPRSYGYSSVTDIQVLCPGRKGELGTVELNKHLREAINPPARGKAEVKVNGALFRLGDKVMQIRNDYNLPWTKEDDTAGEGVFNGDMGVITEIDKPGGAIHVRIDDKDVVYDFERASNELEPAYAVTVHKSQGNEFPAVVIPVLDPPRQLCYRNLLYTGVTRAKQLLILVGRRGVIDAMVENNRKTKRYTGLKWFLQNQEEGR